ncbi:hypothetical protein AVEN_104916-1 [Araneus ventricosus]|uniref:Uncharacterized protein n=1 Tax=Araneus ventricosus TaxID=182803 RepID=A0A4Y2RNV2_ARAVE|nr:hypothetical protein AVEN_104916-1 [Araneus ventricosus]
MALCWHLAAEMQFYVVSPIFLLSLLRWQRFGYSLASSIIILSGLTSFLITKRCNLIYGSFVQLDLYNDDLETFMDRFWMYCDKLYNKPYTRISSYLMGVLLGYHFYGKDFKDIRNRWTGYLNDGRDGIEFPVNRKYLVISILPAETDRVNLWRRDSSFIIELQIARIQKEKEQIEKEQRELVARKEREEKELAAKEREKERKLAAKEKEDK